MFEEIWWLILAPMIGGTVGIVLMWACHEDKGRFRFLQCKGAHVNG